MAVAAYPEKEPLFWCWKKKRQRPKEENGLTPW